MVDQFPYFYNPKIDEETNKKVNMEILKYAGIYVLKKLDLPLNQGGYCFEVPLMGNDQHLEPVLDDLLFNNLVKIDTLKAQYALTPEGRDYITNLISEIESYMNKYQEFEPATRVNIMKRDKVNPLRARFLWGLYDGEFDDFDKWQEDWNININERISDWREVICKKEFYDMLFEDILNVQDMDDESLLKVIREAEADRERERGNAPQVQITRIEGNSNIPTSNQYVTETVETVTHPNYYYYDPYYFNPVYDPFFWYCVYY